MTDHDPLPEELAGLFAAERAAPAGDADARTQVRSRLAGAVGLLPGKAAALTGTATLVGTTGKIISIIAISIGIGVTASTVANRSEPAYAATPAIQLLTPEETAPATPQRVVQSEERLPPVPAQDVTRLAPETATVIAQPASPSEAKLLKRAWFALSSGDARRALDLTDEAERLHSNGALVEEREALRIQALAALGSPAEARTAAQQFIVQFPQSVHRARVESVLTAKESP
jgi:hypothetical protein